MLGELNLRQLESSGADGWYVSTSLTSWSSNTGDRAIMMHLSSLDDHVSTDCSTGM